MPVIIPSAEILATRNLQILDQLLRNDGIIAYPTDTLYGIGGNFLSPAVHKRIDAIKGRNDRPYSVALSEISRALPLIHSWPQWLTKYRDRLFPGPFTLLFTASTELSPLLLHGSACIGVRVPGDPFPRSAFSSVGIPVISTSVNRSGDPPVNNPARIAAEFPEIDLIIDGGELADSPGSTVLDARKRPMVPLRRGAGWELLFSLGIIQPD